MLGDVPWCFKGALRVYTIQSFIVGFKWGKKAMMVYSIKTTQVCTKLALIGGTIAQETIAHISNFKSDLNWIKSKVVLLS